MLEGNGENDQLKLFPSLLLKATMTDVEAISLILCR